MPSNERVLPFFLLVLSLFHSLSISFSVFLPLFPPLLLVSKEHNASFWISTVAMTSYSLAFVFVLLLRFLSFEYQFIFSHFSIAFFYLQNTKHKVLSLNLAVAFVEFCFFCAAVAMCDVRDTKKPCCKSKFTRHFPKKNKKKHRQGNTGTQTTRVEVQNLLSIKNIVLVIKKRGFRKQ